ncbi:hypothetical protein [Paenibacillus agricola]|uniref:Uncharacterized protein n=1 Tax=Paenibacillus agricola TaxID=2716264 RepID=A0ABX0JM13_9BACL|nr:hypothetical protein [Paenibacillus agricola]NHN35396.1 hypothetical protein [Paenibacillus agricola]
MATPEYEEMEDLQAFVAGKFGPEVDSVGIQSTEQVESIEGNEPVGEAEQSEQTEYSSWKNNKENFDSSPLVAAAIEAVSFQFPNKLHSIGKLFRMKTRRQVHPNSRASDPACTRMGLFRHGQEAHRYLETFPVSTRIPGWH